MLAAEFFEKTYRNDDRRSVAAPRAAGTGTEPKNAKNSSGGGRRRSVNSSSNNNRNGTHRDGLADFAVIVSEAYRHECSMNNHVRSEEQEHTMTSAAVGTTTKSPGTATTRLSDRKSRIIQRGSPKTASAPSKTKDRSTLTWRTKNVQHQPVYLQQYQERQFLEKKSSPAVNPDYKTPVKGHQRQRNNDHYCSSPETSPIGVMDEWVSLRGVLSKQQSKKKKKEKEVPPSSIEVPAAGLLDIRDQVLLQERCEQEKVVNRELKQMVHDLQNQISTLQKAEKKRGDKTPKKYINQYDESSNEDDDSSNDGPNVSKDCSGILEECLVPISSSPLPIETISPRDHPNLRNNSSSNNNKRHYKAQLEESKQIIQMLFRDLKVSKQNESDLATKLKAANIALHKEKQRSRENTRIAMKSADDVRASLRKSLRSGNNETEQLERLKQELAQAREECLRWKRKEQMARRAAEIKSKSKLYKVDMEQEKENQSVTARRRQQLLENRKQIVQNEAAIQTGRKAHCDQPKNDERPIKSEPNKEKNSSERLAAVSNKLEPVPTSSTSPCHAISQPNNRSLKPSVVEESNQLPIAESKPQKDDKKQQHHHQQSKILGACSTSGNEDSMLHTRRLDFFSCVAKDLQDDEQSNSPRTTTKTLSNSVGPQDSQDNKTNEDSTLGELMMELKASKQRLQTADEKLNRLVNKDGLLLDCKVVRSCDNPKVDGAIDVVNSSNDVIEVSHRSFAYV
mmetsp:Transcript_19089/g.47453  ORF Transcript_19089/g.47453 Transcript_19089/m.47453 type:complete len:737 (+) Transcript_19089:175-2385(+)